MRMRFVRRGGAIGVVVAASLVFGALPASAAPGDGSAYVAKVSLTLPAVTVGPLAASSTAGPTEAGVASVDAGGLVTAGVATSSAKLDEATGVVQAKADIANVKLGLAVLGGTIDAVGATCEATQSGITGAANLAGVKIAGVTVAANPAPNTTINLAGVKIVFNEQVTNPDGSLTVNAVHITLNALVTKGDVVLAQARCGPAAPPVPLASGLGLWLGLGLLALAAIPAAVVIRRRHAAAV
jgi:hypothetical protein